MSGKEGFSIRESAENLAVEILITIKPVAAETRRLLDNSELILKLSTVPRVSQGYAMKTVTINNPRELERAETITATVRTSITNLNRGVDAALELLELAGGSESTLHLTASRKIQTAVRMLVKVFQDPFGDYVIWREIGNRCALNLLDVILQEVEVLSKLTPIKFYSDLY